MTDDRLPWFKCFPSKLLGALGGMQHHEGYTYVVVILRIYEIGGPCADSIEALARRTGLQKSKVSDAIERLVTSGKLTRTDEGLVNPFADAMLQSRDECRKSLKTAGTEGAKKRWRKSQSNQTNGHGLPYETTMAFHADLDLENRGREVSIKKDSDDWPDDYVEQFWTPYPAGRKAGKKVVAAKLATIRKNKEVTFADLMAGLGRYVASQPGQYAKAPVAWLNAGMWDGDFVSGRSTPARRTFADIAKGESRE